MKRILLAALLPKDVTTAVFIISMLPCKPPFASCA